MTGRLQSLADMRAFVGQDVVITLDYDDPDARVSGHLVSISDEGEVVYVGGDGLTHHGWPCLAVAAPARTSP